MLIIKNEFYSIINYQKKVIKTYKDFILFFI